jgi:hypothetical protein
MLHPVLRFMFAPASLLDLGLIAVAPRAAVASPALSGFIFKLLLSGLGPCFHFRFRLRFYVLIFNALAGLCLFARFRFRLRKDAPAHHQQTDRKTY